jgi:Mg-chelatase subunit ChlD
MRSIRIGLLAACLIVLHGVAVRTGPLIGPIRIVLLVDSSGAMAPMTNEFRDGLNVFLDALPGDPEIAIISTGGQLRVRVPPTKDRERLRRAAQGFTSDGGGNSFLETLLEADKRFLQNMQQRRPVLVIVTTDNGTVRGDVRIDAYNRFIRDFMKRNGRGHGIVLINRANSSVTSDIVMNLTDNTGGFYDSLVAATALPDRMKVLAENVAAEIF